MNKADIDEILDEASREVASWPKWAQEPQHRGRYPINLPPNPIKPLSGTLHEDAMFKPRLNETLEEEEQEMETTEKLGDMARRLTEEATSEHTVRVLYLQSVRRKIKKAAKKGQRHCTYHTESGEHAVVLARVLKKEKLSADVHLTRKGEVRISW